LVLRNQGDRLITDNKNYRQQGVSVMAKGILPFKYEAEKNTTQ